MKNQFSIMKPYRDALVSKIKVLSPIEQLQLWNVYADNVLEERIYSMDELDEFFSGFTASELVECLDSNFNLAHDYFQMDGLGFYRSFDWYGLSDAQMSDIAFELLTADKHESEYYPYLIFRPIKSEYEHEMSDRF